MAKIAVVFSCLAIAGMVIGLISPRKSLFWYKGKRSRVQVLKIYSFLLFLSFIAFAITEGPG